MGSEGAAIRYRPDALVRWVPPAMGPLLLGLWIWSVTKTGETHLLPTLVALSAAIGLAGWWIGAAPCVALTPDALVIRSIRGTRSLPWSDIAALERRFGRVWAMTRSGWYVLSVSGIRPAVGRPADGRTLGDAVWFTWLERRGDDWGWVPLDPWSPPRDVRGRVVMRPPLALRTYPLSLPLYVLTAASVPIRDPNVRLADQLAFAAIAFLVTLAVVVAYHSWARVTIDDREVVTRSVAGGTIRIRRGDVRGLREVETRRWVTGGRVTRLALVVSEPPPLDATSWWPPIRLVTLPAPATVPVAWADDPGFYRVWTWLFDELVAVDGAAPAAAVDPADRD